MITKSFLQRPACLNELKYRECLFTKGEIVEKSIKEVLNIFSIPNPITF